MILTDKVTGESISFTDDLNWEDEFGWNKLVSNKSYSLNGTLIVQQSTRTGGRPIVLKSVDKEMGWVRRSIVTTLYAWSEIPNRKFTLTFTRVGDGRSFTVIFDHASEATVSARPVKEFPCPNPNDWFLIDTLKFVEVME